MFADLSLAEPSAFDVADLAEQRTTCVVLIAGWRDEVSERAVRNHRGDAVPRRPFEPEALLSQLQCRPERTG